MLQCQRSTSCLPSSTPSSNTNGRKQKVSSQTSELEALEARLKAAEDRLRAAGIAPSSPPAGGNGRSSPSSNGKASPRARPAIGQDTFSPTRGEHGPTSPLATEFKSASRPQTKDGRPQTKDGRAVEGSTMPGASPPTPGASEGEFSSDPETSDKEFVVVKNDRVVQELPANLDEDGDEVVSPTEQN